MAIASEASIRTRIVVVVGTVTGSGRVHPRYLRALDGQEKTFNETFKDDNERINAQMVRRIQRIPVVDKYNRQVSVTHIYSILINYGVSEEADSEGTVQQFIEDLAAAFAARPHFELEVGVKSTGLDGVTHRQIGMDRFTDSKLGEKLVHAPELRLVVDAEDC